MVEPQLTIDAMRCARAGSSLGFTLYAQFGEQPTKADPYLGVFNNQLLTQLAVDAINRRYVPQPLPWVAMGRLIYPEPGMERLDDFIAVMLTPAVARWVANAVAELEPEGATDADTDPA